MENNKEAQAMYEAIIRKSIQWYETEVQNSGPQSHVVSVPVPQSVIPNKR